MWQCETFCSLFWSINLHGWHRFQFCSQSNTYISFFSYQWQKDLQGQIIMLEMSFLDIQQASPVCVQSNCIYTYLLFILLPSLTICFWRAAGLLLRASNHCIEACIILIYEFLIRLNFCGYGSQAISWTNLLVAVKAFLEQPLSLL